MPHITKRADGKYLIRISKGSGSNRRYTNKTFHGTLKQARARARELETQIDQGIRSESVLSFENYFEMWLKAVTSRLQPRTLDGYEQYIRRYVLPSLASVALADIEPWHVQRIVDGMDLSPTTVRNLHASLRACFAHAVKKQYLNTNPCRGIDLPKKKRTRDMVVLDEAETANFIARCREAKNGVIFAFALQTGMRPEEYLALRWSDITGSEIIVRQAVQYRKGGGFYFKDLKTKSSRRRIPVSQPMREWLAAHRRSQLEHRLAMKGMWHDHDLVFANTIGHPFSIQNLTRRYFRPVIDVLFQLIDEQGEPVVDNAGKPVRDPSAKNLTLYSLRHTMATLLLLGNVHVKIVSERLGHSSVTLTLDTYSHVLPHIQEDATEKLGKVMNL